MTPPGVAVESGGYGVFLPACTGVGSRIAFVDDDDAPEIGHSTVEATAQRRASAVHVEVAGITGASQLRGDVGIGNGGIDLRAVVGATTHQAFGLGGTIPGAPGGELEIILGESAVHLRALARQRPGAGVDLDIGLAMAPVEMSDDPTLQGVAAVRKRRR